MATRFYSNVSDKEGELSIVLQADNFGFGFS